MKNVFEKLKKILNARSIEEISENIENPDSFTINIMKYHSDATINLDNEYMEFGNAFNEMTYNNDYVEAFKGLTCNSNATELINKLNDSNIDYYTEVATFIQNNLQIVKGINLKNKSVASIIWASTIYKHISDAINHLGIDDMNDSFEICALHLTQAISEHVISKIPKDFTIEKVKEEVYEIFKDTEFMQEVKDYFATAYIKNDEWENEEHLDSWYDFEKFESIIISNQATAVDSNDSLIEALKKPTCESYQQAIEYVRNTYFAESENNFGADAEILSQYKALITVATLATDVVSENSDQFNNIAYNLISKIISTKEMLENSIGRSSIVIKASQAYEEILTSITKDAKIVAHNISGNEAEVEESLVSENNGEILAEESLTKTKAVGKVAPKFKGAKKTLIQQYLQYFTKKGQIVSQKAQQYNTIANMLDAIIAKKSYSSKDEDFITLVSNELSLSIELASPSTIPNKLERVKHNAQLLLPEIEREYDQLSAIGSVYDQVRKTFGDNLDIQEVPFDKDVLGKTRTRPQYEKIIKTYYQLVEGLVKNLPDVCRMLPTEAMRKAEMYEEIRSNPEKYRYFEKTIKEPSKKTLAELTSYKLYINEDGNENEQFKELYEKISDSKASISEKQEAFIIATTNSEIPQEQQAVIEQYIQELEAKEKKKKEKEEKRIAEEAEKAQAEAGGYDAKTGQFTMDIPVPEGSDSEDENENE